jgi:hypothetical protein
MCEPMTTQNSPRVGVHNKDGAVPCVKKDAIGRFWADAVHLQELLPQLGGGCAEHRLKRTAVRFAQKSDESFELAGLLAIVTRRADQACQPGQSGYFDLGRGEQAGLAQVRDRELGIFPGGVLDQDGADDDFEGSATGPPTLLAIGQNQRIKIFLENGEALRRGCAEGFAGALSFADRRAGVRGIGQGKRRRHLIRKITTARRQVKKALLTARPRTCSRVQVLANSQLVSKNWHRSNRLFAMLSVGCTISRERCGCLSV